MKISKLHHDVFSIDSRSTFEAKVMEIFQYQATNNLVYNNYLSALKIAWKDIHSVSEIPFLPIEFFKTHDVVTGTFNPEITFYSSGTGAGNTSKHHVRKFDLYQRSFLSSFLLHYGDPSDFVIFALLPNYLEREGSSLIAMIQKLIELSNDQDSGFFLYDHAALQRKLVATSSKNKKVLLIGVTFALLDFASAFPMNIPKTVVMETGGMKGRREELIREDVAQRLMKAFGVPAIHSEYGMTELLSQAYSFGHGIFRCPPWMAVSVRDTSDPLSNHSVGSGALNIIDLANIDSCSFIATQDLGKVYDDGSFEVIGRFDRADVRGCNLMIV